MPNFLNKISSFKPIEKKDKGVKECQTVMMALHPINATMFPKPHFIHHVESTHTKIAYTKLKPQNCILKIGL